MRDSICYPLALGNGHETVYAYLWFLKIFKPVIYNRGFLSYPTKPYPLRIRQGILVNLHERVSEKSQLKIFNDGLACFM